MSNEEKALSTMGMDRQIVVTSEQLDLVKKTIFPAATDDELKLFIYHCQRKGVHPLDRLIHPVKRGLGADAKVTFQNSIDYMRSEAEGTGEYDGQDEPEFIWDEEKDPEHTGFPLEAKVRVYRKGMSRPTIGGARWKEFYPGEKMGFQWRQMPCVMLAKCAEAQALRKAFPKQLGDLYTPEEMAQAGADPGQKNKDRSASVKPQGTGKQVQAEDAQFRDLTIEDEITNILAELCNGDYSSMDELLKQTSHYEDKGKTFSFGMDRLPSVSANWKGKILPKLKALKQDQGREREPGEEG